MALEKAPFDVCSSYHGGNEVSREANLRTNKESDIERILAFMRTRPGTKTWVKEVIRELGGSHQTLSARLSDLKAAGVIEVVEGERREKCGVVRLVEREPVQVAAGSMAR